MNAAAEQGTNQNPPTASMMVAHQPAANTRGERRLLSKAQVAARLGCSERSLERLVKQGRFPASRRYGRAVVWFEAAVEHVLGLAEQEQLQWHPAATHPLGVFTTMAAQAAQPPVPSSIPEAHELEPTVVPNTACKPRRAAGSSRRREPTGASASDLEALGKVFELPTV